MPPPGTPLRSSALLLPTPRRPLRSTTPPILLSNTVRPTLMLMSAASMRTKQQMILQFWSWMRSAAQTLPKNTGMQPTWVHAWWIPFSARLVDLAQLFNEELIDFGCGVKEFLCFFIVNVCNLKRISSISFTRQCYRQKKGWASEKKNTANACVCIYQQPATWKRKTRVKEYSMEVLRSAFDSRCKL